uniref:Uncharacterized protein n=1 Tax=Melopsittacus undulatus TaxID=13146 RepID=A0A8V5GR82_MELUD
MYIIGFVPSQKEHDNVYCIVKRKKQAAPEKPVKKQKIGESSKGTTASKQSNDRNENMFQVKLFEPITHCPPLQSLMNSPSPASL